MNRVNRDLLFDLNLNLKLEKLKERFNFRITSYNVCYTKLLRDKDMKNFDPEISDNGGLGYQYPLTRSYNFGFSITFN